MATPSLPAGAAAGSGTKCTKWAIKLVQKTNTKGKYSPKGVLKGMSGIPYEVTANGKQEKGSLDGNGKSKIFAGAAPGAGPSLAVLFGLKILPDYSSIDAGIFGKTPDEVNNSIGGDTVKGHIDKCAIRLSMALNASKNGKYIIPREHKIQKVPGRSFTGADNNIYLISSIDMGKYLDSNYSAFHTPKGETMKGPKETTNLDYRNAYNKDYTSPPKAFYRLKASFGASDGASSPAAGHVDLFEGVGLTKHLVYYTDPVNKYNPTEFYLWIFTEVVFLKQEQEGDVCVYFFEHQHDK